MSSLNKILPVLICFVNTEFLPLCGTWKPPQQTTYHSLSCRWPSRFGGFIYFF